MVKTIESLSIEIRMTTLKVGDEIIVNDITGRKIFGAFITDKNGIELSLENISKGIYSVSVVRNNHLIATKKLVKI